MPVFPAFSALAILITLPLPGAPSPSGTPVFGGVVINEVMYAPSGGEPEWIELKNGSTEEVNIGGLMLSDAARTSRHPIAAGTLLLAPGGFVTLTRDSALLAGSRSGIPGRVINVPGFPSLNNTGDAVFVYERGGMTMDSVVYRPHWGGATGGASLERCDALRASSDSVNWGPCGDPAKGTPGRENSIARREYDACLLRGRGEEHAGQSWDLIVIVYNAGRQPLPAASLLLFDDLNADAVASAGELLVRLPLEGGIAPEESLAFLWGWSAPPPGIHAVIAVVDWSEDQRRANDTVRFTVTVGAERGTVIVNEIMFAPLPGEAEYVEVMNAGTQAVNLGGWTVSDRPGISGTANTLTIPGPGRMIAAREFAVIAGDSGIFRFFPGTRALDPLLVIIPRGGIVSLNNEGDDVVLRDAAGNVIDSVCYVPAWHNPAVIDRTGYSLERILPSGPPNEPTNWTTCVLPEGGTPGRSNSAALRPSVSGAMLVCSPNPFSPDNDGVDDATVVHYQLPRGVWSVQANVFDVRGRLIRRLATSVPGTGQGDLLWDGRDDRRVKARIGIYIVLMEAWDELHGEKLSAKAAVVLAGRL